MGKSDSKTFDYYPYRKENSLTCKNLPEKGMPFYKISQKLEIIAVRFALLSNLYCRVFYKKMLEKEMEMSNLQPGASVLHVGCGSYPYTALYLAQKGLFVEAWDCNNAAVKKAGELIQKKNMADRVKVFCADGCQISAHKHDAIWVSLNVSPKAKILEWAFYSLKDGGLLIFRNLPAWMSINSCPDSTYAWSKLCHLEKNYSMLGTESVVVRKKIGSLNSGNLKF